MTHEQADEVVRILARRYGPWGVCRAGWFGSYLLDLDFIPARDAATAWVAANPDKSPLPGDIRALAERGVKQMELL